MKQFIRISLALLVIAQLLSHCSALGGSRGGGKSLGGRSNKANAPQTFAGTSLGVPGQNATRRGLGISAWGLVAVIVSLILAGMGFYYFSMCYPILCKKERKYDMIGLPSVA